MFNMGEQITYIHIISKVDAIKMVYMIIDVDLDHLAEVVFVNFLQFRITLCSLPYCGLQEVIMHSQLLRSEELCFPPLGWLIRIQYLEFNCVEALFYFLHLLI